MPNKRDVSPIIQMIRKILLQRENVNMLRFKDEIAARTQPPPNLPEGPSHKLAANYYYTRDGRRLVKPEEVLFEGNKPLKLPEGCGQPVATVNRTPGKVYKWDI